MAEKTELMRCVEKVIKRFGSLRAVSTATNIDVGYLHRLHSGVKTCPSDGTLFALGIERIVSYRLIGEVIQEQNK